MITYCCEFEMDGSRYIQHIEAESFEDAEKRIAAIRQSLVLLGKYGGSIRATGERSFVAIAKRMLRRSTSPELKIVPKE